MKRQKKKLVKPYCDERKIQKAILELQQLQQKYRTPEVLIVYHAIDVAFKVITNGIEVFHGMKPACKVEYGGDWGTK